VQLSSGWINSVLNNIANAGGTDSPAYQAVQSAFNNGTLKTVVAGLNKGTGQLVVVPVTVPSL
jgi:filamentous hemagglutinin